MTVVEKKPYKGWEYFCDISHYHMWAVRPVGCEVYFLTHHVKTEKEAIEYIDEFCRRVV